VGLRVDSANLHIDTLDPPRIGKVGRTLGGPADSFGLTQPRVIPLASIADVAQNGSRLDIALESGERTQLRVADTVTTPVFSRRNAAAATDLKVTIESLSAQAKALGIRPQPAGE
jgi:hypothetical protein